MGLNVSEAWKTAIAEQFRDQGYLSLIIKVVPPGIRSGASVSSSSTHALASASAMIDGTEDTIEPVVTLENNRWRGDGSMYLPSSNPAENKSIAWWDNSIVHSDVTNTVLTFTFDQAYTIPGIYGIWDTETNSWPSKLVIEGYNILDTLVNTYTITDIDDVQKYVEAPFTDIKKLVLKIQGWSVADWRARCTEIIFGLYLKFNRDDIFNVSFKSAASPIAEELPVCTATVTIGNYTEEFDPLLITGYSKYLKAKQATSMQWGFKLPDKTIEHAPAQQLFITAVNLTSDSSVFNLVLGTRLNFLTADYTLGDYTGTDRALSAIAAEVLDNSDLLKATDTEVPYTISSTLDGIYSNAPIPVKPTNVIMQLIANAAGCVLDTDPESGYIRIHDLETSPVRTIDKQPQLGDPSITIDEQLYKITIGVYHYEIAASATTVYKSKLLLSGTTTIKAEYSENMLAKNVTASVTNGTVVATYYGRYADLQVTPTNPSTPVEVVLSGYKVTQSVTYIETYKNATLDRGLEIIVENPFITNTAYLATLTTLLRNHYNKRQEISVPYTGFPELMAADAVQVINKYGTSSGVVLSNEIAYNGGWTGKYEAKLGGDA